MGETEFELNRNDKEQILILADIPDDTERGLYIYKLTVTRGGDGTTYDFPVQMTIKVP